MKSKIMRTIKFRGKNKKTNEWVYGDLVVVEDAMHNVVRAKIITHCFAKSFNGGGFDHYSISTLIEPETIGQFTGLVDKNGTEIYEGDVINITDGDDELVGFGVVEWLDDWGLWYVDGNGHANDGLFDIRMIDYIEIIGNIHDNPEILKNND